MRIRGFSILISPSALLLIAANLVPLYGVFALGWQVFPVLLLFWLENVIVGLFNVLRILLARPDEVITWFVKIFLCAFFIVHYGMFTSGHGFFIFSFFGNRNTGPNIFIDADVVMDALVHYHLGIPALALFISHGFSFVANYIGKGEYKTANPQFLMMRPYGRIVVLHVTIIFGGFLVMALDAPAATLALLILFKIGLDLRAHFRDHKRRFTPDAAAA